MKKLISGIAVVMALVVVGLSASALATASDKFTTRVLGVGRFDEINAHANAALPHQVKLKTKGDSDVYMVENTVLPGGSSGWHTHPGPSLIIVKQGTATFYDGDDPSCTPQTYPAGSGVVDPGDGHIHLLRNEGSADLVTVTMQILPAGAPRRIDAADPGNCDV